MNLVSGDMLWTNINKIPEKYSYLSEDINCDVLIVGAGITGAICSYYFTEAGIQTAIIDKNIIGYGSTSASTSILQYEIDTDLVGLKGTLGLDNAVECFKLCEKTVYEIEKVVDNLDCKCGFNLRDCFYYTDSEADVSRLKKEYEVRKNHGFNVEFIDSKKANNMFSFPVKAGIYSRSGAGDIDPYSFTHKLISHSIKKGLRVFENTEMISIRQLSEEVEVTTKNRFKINTKKVIFASGFEAKEMIDSKTAILTRTFTLVTKPIGNFDGWNNRCIIRNTNNPYTYLRTTSDDRIIIGGEDLELGGKNSKVSCLTNDDTVVIDKYGILNNRLLSMFPKIDNMEVEYRFSGLFGESGDGLPYIGEYEKYPNCYFCLGYGSNGILYAVIGAQLIRDLYLGNPSKLLDLFKIDR
ncbi:NAD(P)/FAD-dependent oxidoreductase [Wukongibacter sp. M2B1]|uniref:NAD(P)/FAD-dependent oxidoreductase n=1 Tax=Wukongibacter sp. M2B1 TaxID=3088895 RepID=UPI003D7BB603